MQKNKEKNHEEGKKLLLAHFLASCSKRLEVILYLNFYCSWFHLSLTGSQVADRHGNGRM